MGLFKSIKNALQTIKGYLEARNARKKAEELWRNANSHNYTKATADYRWIAEVGNHTYGTIDVYHYGNPSERLQIGHFCSIAAGVTFLTGGNHPLNTLSQYPFDAYFKTGVPHSTPTKGPIVVEDDVWIGMGATILSGAHIGQGAVIAAQSTVAKDVPPYAIYAGNKVVKYRFPEKYIEKLIKFDYSKLTPEDIIKNRDILGKEIDDSFFESEFYKSHLKD
ncbi:MAG: CatB-related O-acetyltransferase [Clostridia bacterium]|nr:CatB-related O-acetyltransferase [Clostridia bacterium]